MIPRLTQFSFVQKANFSGFFYYYYCASVICFCVLPLAAQTKAVKAPGNSSAPSGGAVNSQPNQLLPAPVAPAADTLPLTTSCAALARDETEELKQALELLDSAGSPDEALAKLVANRPELAVSDNELQAWRESLPAQFKTRLLTKKEVEGNPSNLRALKIARRVSDGFGFKNRFLMFYQSDKPLFATWKGQFVLVSTKAIELLTLAEIAGQIAHETAHLFYLDELKKALEKGDFRAARIVELRCDLVAMLMLERLKLDSRGVASGLSVMTNWLTKHNQIKPVPTHPTLCLRQELSNELAARLKSDFGKGDDNRGAVNDSLSQSRGWLAFQAKIYYGRNDEDSTFVTNTKFILLDQSLVKILKNEGFKFDAEPAQTTKSRARGVKRRSSGSSRRNRIKEPPPDDFDYLRAAVDVLKTAWTGQINRNSNDQDGDDSAILFVLLSEALNRHQVGMGETNWWGMSAFSAVKPGDYYLFGFLETEHETIVWHLPVLIRAGNNRVELDQYNAEAILPL